MDVILLNGQVPDYFMDTCQVVNGSLHGRSDVRTDNGWNIPVNIDGFAQVFQIHGAIGMASNHDVSDIQNTHNFIHRVMGVLRVINNAFRVKFASKEKSVHITFGPAIGHIAPEGILRSRGELAKYL